MLPARPPVPSTAAFDRGLALPACVPILLLRLPQTAAREPPEQHVFVGTFQLVERRQQLLLIARTECRRLPVDEDGPVREAWRHQTDLGTNLPFVSFVPFVPFVSFVPLFITATAPSRSV